MPLTITNPIIISPRAVIRGDDTRLFLQAGTQVPTDELGVSSMTRVFKCRRDLVTKYEPRNGDRDPVYSYMRVIDWIVIEGPVFSEIRVRYNGIPRSRGQIVKERPGYAIRTATLFTKIGGSLTLRYLAPLLSRSYAATEKPTYADPFNVKGFREPVKELSLVTSTGVTLIGDGAAFLRQFIPVKVETLRTQLDAPPDGWIFRVTETIERNLVQETNVKLSLLLGGKTPA